MAAGFYGITLTVQGDSVEQIKKIQAALEGLGVQYKNAQQEVERANKSMGDDFERLKNIIIGAFAIDRIKDFGREILNTTAEFEGFENRIKFASLNTADAARNMNYLRDTVTNLHVPIREAYEGFSQMEAGLAGTAIQGDRLRQLFTGITIASTTLHLPTDQLQRTLYDLKEIGEVGVNMRVGRSLMQQFTGIGPVIKEVFHKSLMDLAKEKFSGTEFLEKLGPALAKYYAGGQAAYAESLQAKMADVSNRFYQSQVDLGEKLKPVYMSIMNSLIGVMDSIKNFTDYLYRNKDTVVKIAEAVRGLVIAFVAYKTVMIANNAITALSTVQFTAQGIAIGGATVATEGLTTATEGLAVAWSSLGIGAIAVGLGLVIEKFIEWNDQLEESLEKISHLKELTKANVTQGDAYDQIIQQVGVYNQLGTGAKQALRVNVNDLLTQVQKNEDDVSKQMLITKNALSKIHGTVENVRDEETGRSKKMMVMPDSWYDLQKQLQGQESLYNTNQTRMRNLMHFQDLMDKEGITGNTGGSGSGATGAAAGEIAGLSGAHGGLGQAKVINIHINNLQNNEISHADGHDIIEKGKMGVELLERMLLNVGGYSQSAIM